MSDKRILGFDTSGTTCSVALLDGKRIAAYAEEAGESRQAERLFAKMEEIFRGTGLTYNNLDAITFTTGPGSFTGVRVGIAAARGIRLATKLPQIGVNSLEAIAWRVIGKDQPIFAVIDAKRGQLYGQVFSPELDPLSEPLILTLKQVAAVAPEKEFILIGNGSELAAPLLDVAGKKFTLAKGVNVPDAKAVVRVAAIRLAQGQGDTEIKPLYLRKPEARIETIRFDIKRLVNS